MIKSIISDLGKVIVDFDNNRFFSGLSRYCSYSFDEIVWQSRDHLHLHLAFDSGEIDPQEFYLKVKQVLSANLDQDEFFRLYNDIFSLNEKVVQTFQKLKGKCRLIILSNTDPERFGFIKKTFPAVLDFDDFVLSFEQGFLKPQKEIYKIALKKAQALPSECVFIDDMEENISAAASLGFNTIHFKPGTNLKSELRRFQIE